MGRYYIGKVKMATHTDAASWTIYDSLLSDTKPAVRVFDDVMLANEIVAALNESVARKKK